MTPLAGSKTSMDDKTAKSKPFKVMTHNPIYTGPIYESIKPQQINNLPPNTMTLSANESEMVNRQLQSKFSHPIICDGYFKSALSNHDDQQSHEPFVAPVSDVKNVTQLTNINATAILNRNGDRCVIIPTELDHTDNNERYESKASSSLNLDTLSNSQVDAYTVMNPVGSIFNSATVDVIQA